MESCDSHYAFRIFGDTCYRRTPVKGTDCSHLLRGKLKIENIGIGLNPFAVDTLRDHDDTALDLIAEGHLTDLFAMLFRNGDK